jgi:hypothetical protein
MSIPCLIWPLEFDQKYPSFIYRSKVLPLEEVCRTLQQIAKFLPFLARNMYYDRNPTETSYTVMLNETTVVKYTGELFYPLMTRFTKDYSLEPFGMWRVDEGPMTLRRFGFVVYENQTTLKDFKPIAQDFVLDIVIGATHLVHFSELHPEMTFQLPAVFIMNRRKSGFLMREGVSDPADFAKLLAQVVKGELDAEMTMKLPQLFPKLVPLPEPTTAEPTKMSLRFLYASPAVGGVALLLWLLKGRFAARKEE